MRTLFTLLLALLLATPAAADLVIVDSNSSTVTVDLPGYGWSRGYDFNSLKTAIQTVTAAGDDDSNPGTAASVDTLYVIGVYTALTAGSEIQGVDWNTNTYRIIGDPDTSPTIFAGQNATFTVTVTSAANGLIWDNVSLDLEAAAGANTPWGFQFPNSQANLTFRNMSITGGNLLFYHGNGGQTACNAWTFDNITLAGKSTSTDGWLKIRDDVDNVTITNCTFDGTNTADTGSGALVYIESSDGLEITNNRFVGMDITSGGAVQYMLQLISVVNDDVDDALISGNTFEYRDTTGSGNTQYGIHFSVDDPVTNTLGQPLMDSVIKNNVFSVAEVDADDTLYGIWMGKTVAHSAGQQWIKNTFVSGNRFSDLDVGLSMRGWTRNMGIVNNYFLSCTQGVVTEGLRSSVLSRNYFDNVTSAFQIFAPTGANNLGNTHNAYVGNYIQLSTEIYDFETANAPQAAASDSSYYGGNLTRGVTRPMTGYYNTWAAWSNVAPTMPNVMGEWGMGDIQIEEDEGEGLEATRALPRN